VDTSIREDRAGRYARSLARDKSRKFVKDTWLPLLLIMLLGVAIGGLVVLLPGWMRGFVGGVWIASVVWFVALLVISGSGAAATSMGASAEQWTDREMRRLRKHGWKITSHVRPWIKGGDLDHLAIGPAGAVAIESKWISDPRALQQSSWIESDRRQATIGADYVRKTLRGRLHGAPIRSAVVYWGAATRSGNARTSFDHDPQVLIGSELRDWLTDISAAPELMTDGDIQSAWATVLDFQHKTDLQELGEGYEANRTLIRKAIDALVVPISLLITFWVAALLLGAVGGIALLPVAALLCGSLILYFKSDASQVTRRRAAGAATAASAFVIVLFSALYVGSWLFHF
jgi:Nuclease-related domain